MKQTKMMMKVAETRLGTGLTRGSGSSHLPRKSRVSSNENEPRRWMNFAVLVHNRSAPADGGRLQRLFPSRSKVRTRPALSSDLDERARSVGRPEVYPPFSGLFKSPGRISSTPRQSATSRIHDCAPHTRAFGHLRGHRTCRDTPQTTNVSPNPRNTIRVALDSPPRLRFSRRINNGKLNFQT